MRFLDQGFDKVLQVHDFSMIFMTRIKLTEHFFQNYFRDKLNHINIYVESLRNKTAGKKTCVNATMILNNSQITVKYFNLSSIYTSKSINNENEREKCSVKKWKILFIVTEKDHLLS